MDEEKQIYDREDITYKRVKDIISDIKDIRENVLGNFNKRIIDNTNGINSLDERTRIFVPKRMNND